MALSSCPSTDHSAEVGPSAASAPAAGSTVVRQLRSASSATAVAIRSSARCRAVSYSWRSRAASRRAPRWVSSVPPRKISGATSPSAAKTGLPISTEDATPTRIIATLLAICTPGPVLGRSGGGRGICTCTVASGSR
jgi:hypothetical protein